MSPGDTGAAGFPIVVAEKKSSVHVLGGLLSVAFTLALIRGHFGADTDTGRVVGDVIFGLLAAGSIAGWIWFIRHPARLEITPETISFVHRDRARAVTLERSAGDVYVARTFTHRTQLVWLKVTGSDTAISMTTFDLSEVERACTAAGWRFAKRPG